MQIEKDCLYFTKMLVPIKDARTVQTRLLDVGFGYELALEKDFTPRKFSKKNIAVAFYIDHNGYLEYSLMKDYNDLEFEAEFRNSPEDEINHSVVY